MDKSVSDAANKAFLAHLREARRGLGITQEDLAGKLGETQSFISKVEKGERRIDLIELRTWCGALGISFAQFVQDLDEKILESEEKRSARRKAR